LPEKCHPLADPSAEIERRDLRQALETVLLQLPEKYRAPVVLCDLEGRTHQEAATELGWPSGSISRRLERARALLRRRLAHRGLTLLIGLVGLSCAAMLTWSAAHRVDGGSIGVRQIMSKLGTPSKEGLGAASLLAKIVREESTPDPSQVLAMARSTAQVASQIITHDPGRNRADWRGYADEMRLSSLLLVQATEENDRSLMLSAARRLDTSCLKCHKLYRQ
jgi:RNA polymerase sigma-70 factor (ECF subfamily)